MKSNVKLTFLSFIFIAALSTVTGQVGDQPVAETIDVGVAKIDITPERPIRLTGYGNRVAAESNGIIDRLEANALAFGKDSEHPSVLITVDLLGISNRLTSRLAHALSEKAGIDPAQITICASHTHGGPEIGNAINILQYREGKFSDSLLALDHLVHIAEYTELLSQKLEEVALTALKNRKPALVSWGQGQAQFAANRRTKGGPVDPSLPVLRISNADGSLRAIFLNYACHGTTLEGNVTKIHGDWISAARHQIETDHPGTIALIAIGCAGDANPQPRGKLEDVAVHAREIADNINKLLEAQLQPLTAPPTGKMVWVKLPFAHTPTVPELIETSKASTVNGYYARLALERIQRGDSIPADLNYPIQVWNFGDKLAMVNLAGEVVVDYSIRLKNDFGAEQLWVNAYSNDVPCYIASRRIIREGGYEAESSMPFYNKPSPLAEIAEDILIHTVRGIMPETFKGKRDSMNHQELVVENNDGEFKLTAAHAKSVGPTIKYMPEWKAFGWFNTEDRAEWKVMVEKGGKYNVYLKWSVSDAEAGKSFALKAGKKTIRGKTKKSGSWFTYRTEKIGAIVLKVGTHDFIFLSDSVTEKGPMLDLAELTLVRVKD